MTNFDVHDEEFRRAFLFPSMCVNAYHNSTKVIALDGCHIKAKYGGVILSATVLDGNGNVFPAAVGIAESENQDMWRWFLRLLAAALHIQDGGRGNVVLSDREKGLKKRRKPFSPKQPILTLFFTFSRMSSVSINVHLMASSSQRRRHQTSQTS